jgi:hypothetical protein
LGKKDYLLIIENDMKLLKDTVQGTEKSDE